MNNNEKTVGDLTSTVFSFLSLKVKLIIIGIVLGLFFIILIPVIAISAVTGVGGDDDTDSSSISSSEVNATSEVIGSDKLYQYANSKFVMPFETWNTNKDVITSKFSPKRTITVNGVTQTRPHTGIDLVVVSIGSPRICAVLDGKVVVSKAGSTGYGNYVVIEHHLEDMTFYTLYGHMRAGSLMVSEGMEVKAGQTLGIMGSTGNSTGPHLHFEVRVNQNFSSNAVDPYPYLFGN